MRKLVTVPLLALAFAISSRADIPVLKEGDCWTYETRPCEDGSFLVIRKIETSPEGEVVHISIFGLRIKSSTASSGFTDRIRHLPIFARALRASLKEKVQKTIPEIDWARGYRSWSEAHAGGFNEPVSKCVAITEQVLDRGTKH